MLLLGSGSPRRRELLATLGLPFRVVAPEVDETQLPDETPDAYLERVVAAKAGALALEPGDMALLVADTTVLVEGRLLAKPTDPAEARRMLDALSGRTHVVATRFLLRRQGGTEHVETVRTDVRFRALDESERARYAAGGEGADKAGGYAIQGAAAGFVREIHGSYTNVVGLPLAHVAEALAGLGLLP